MQKLFLTIIIIFLTGFTTKESYNTEFEPIVVLELFTSQGCSSCPSADVLLDKIQRDYADKNVLTLSYHVEYWNYIGWKDPFSSKVYTQKQRQYAAKFESGRIYTPQVVVNGKEHFVGSNRSKMNSILSSYSKKKTSNAITFNSVKKEDSKIEFNYSVGGDIKNKTLRAVLVLKERETYVKRGENSQRTLKNTNIVVSENKVSLSALEGTASIVIPDIVEAKEGLRLIVLIEDHLLNITAAAKSEL